MYVYIYTYCIYSNIYIYIYIYIYIHIAILLYLLIYVHLYINIYSNIAICINQHIKTYIQVTALYHKEMFMNNLHTYSLKSSNSILKEKLQTFLSIEGLTLKLAIQYKIVENHGYREIAYLLKSQQERQIQID